MIFTLADIVRFFDEGIANGAKHMIIVTDKRGHSKPPIYANDSHSFLLQFGQCGRDESEQSTEVYYLEKPRRAQIYRSRLVQDMIRSMLSG